MHESIGVLGSMEEEELHGSASNTTTPMSSMDEDDEVHPSSTADGAGRGDGDRGKPTNGQVTSGNTSGLPASI